MLEADTVRVNSGYGNGVQATHDATPPRLVVFAKAPQPGRAKTRLIPVLGAQGAAKLARQMLAHTLEQAMAAKLGPVELCMSPHADDAAWRGIAIPAPVQRSAQGEGDLGQRMARVVQRATDAPGSGVLLIGTDCPALTPALLTQAAATLALHDVVMLPACDGGYVLLGLKTPCPALFDSMPWSTAEVAALTLQRCTQLGLRVWLGPTLPDVDEPTDLHHPAAQAFMNKYGCSPHGYCATGY